MFTKILIANRGEIAVRIMKTARRLGIRTVAVYSEADADALHVESADEAVCIGPAPAAHSYLRGEVILEVARRTGAQAIHPGYGFLAENADFAAACEAAGLVFIGPPAGAIRVMGSKSESKRVMERAGVPLVPGYHGEAQDEATLRREAGRIGYPVLIKASAGGGGKGMRVVREAVGLDEALAGARRESKAAFGDDRLLIERYLAKPRHVEVQVFADRHGHCIHLHDRDCSLQRRHQKIIEEAPAPGLTGELRERMGRAAVAAAQAVNYVGAGTVEFLYEAGEFFFIEMNTRLQVEHPVTEAITGYDLVEWQLRIAGGEPLPARQEQVPRRGHAFEARLYAEDVPKGFLPAIGRVTHLRPPREDAHVRIDSGVRTGDEITVHYDPMIAKLIVWDADRGSALRRLATVLEDYGIAGVTTNLAFLASVARHPAFVRVEIDTGFIERERAGLAMSVPALQSWQLALSAIALLHARPREPGAPLPTPDTPPGPWDTLDGWRMNGEQLLPLRFDIDGQTHSARLHFASGGALEVELVGDARVKVAGIRMSDDGAITAEIDGERVAAQLVRNGGEWTLLARRHRWSFAPDDPLARAAHQDGGSGHLVAPMPGAIIAVLVKESDLVERDQPLIVLEAMKMEHTIRAPVAGRVAKLFFTAGQQASESDELVVIEPLSETRP
ncbi:MAG: acetyl/propionyl/methylcrotonyl-CoA carboxylase subunit alpha [Steroidobacteraceae bacterium]|nr:acetyl/propionyl/methylcrotonyl-CoA carboxylase subunit alpha [Steroidobacteraceae bacterium]MCW5573206.1 acetyl/propionyl/methylcrotonyl-CoA carboxylase subunit alpha [Steroidobacteraceae bacterium]